VRGTVGLTACWSCLRPSGHAAHSFTSGPKQSGNTMAIKLTIGNKVSFKVKGTINNAAGVAEAFDFSLTCSRMDQDEYSTALRDLDGRPIVDFLATVAEDWSGVKDEDGKAVPFSEDAFRQLCKIPGLPGVIFSTYAIEAGAKAKN
jgi:hypothetical protein